MYQSYYPKNKTNQPTRNLRHPNYFVLYNRTKHRVTKNGQERGKKTLHRSLDPECLFFNFFFNRFKFTHLYNSVE